MHISSGEMVGADRLMDGQSIAGSDAFVDAIVELLPSAYRMACALVHSRDEAEDIIQEATLNAWKHRNSVRPNAELRPWFLGIVANQCRQAVRTRWWSVITRPDLSSLVRHANEQRIGDGDVLRQGLLKLHHRDRVVLLLRCYMDMSFDDVAGALHISPQAARVRTHRALARLRPLLDALEERSV